MPMWMRLLPLVAVLALLEAPAARADVVLENPRFRLTLTDGARSASLVEKATGRQLCAPQPPLPVASVRVGGREYGASGASLEEGLLVLRFSGVDTVLRCETKPEADWVGVRLVGVFGTRPERLTLLQIPVSLTANVGTRLNIAWDDRTSVCLMAMSRQVDCGASRRAYALLSAASQDAPGPRLEGAGAALVVAPTPEIRRILRRASHAFGLLTNETPDGVPAKETEAARGAYWFLAVGQNDAEKVIEYCRRSGIRQVMIASPSWCASPGHYLFQKGSFPDGEEGLRRLVAALHRAGIKVGMHTFVSKVAKVDPYVSPRPDRRFWVDRRSALAEEVTPDQTTIRCTDSLREWPGSPVASQKVWEGGVTKHQEVILDDEIIAYESIGPEGRWDTFLGCKRGAWGTRPAAHAAGTEARHYGVDGCINGYIIDQETDLLDEVAERIGGIFTRCDFDMVYFDGGEDVDRTRFNYYVSRFQEAAMRRFRKRPLIHMGTIMTHLLWHSFARDSTVDTYLNTLYGAIVAGAPVEKWPTVREHIDRSVDYMLSVRQDLMPGELGWFGVWPRGRNTDGLQLDEVEYLLCKSLAYDAPVSFQTGFSEMESHPLTPEILEIFRVYDGLRMRRAVPASTLRPLAEKGRDFALVRSGREVRFVPVRPLGAVGEGKQLRACVGATEGGALATLWHTDREADLVLDVPSDRLRAASFAGHPIRVRRVGVGSVLPIGPRRTTLFFPGRSPEEARALLQSARVRQRTGATIRIEAEAFTRLEGAMARGSAVGIREPDASGDVVVPTGAQDRQSPRPWFCEYTVRIPRAGRWYLWARVRYPTGADESFAVVLPGQRADLGMEQALGNCGQNGGKWHWTGRGSGSTTPPPGAPVSLLLKKGRFTFRIYAREGSGAPETAPRLDQLCLSEDPEPPAP